MPTNTVATVVAINAAAQSSHAQDEACAAMLTSFNSAGSNPAQRQLYAECVQRLEPIRTAEDEAGLKVAVGMLLSAAVIGAVIGYARADWDKEIAAFAGFFIAPMGLICVAGLFSLLHWLFA